MNLRRPIFAMPHTIMPVIRLHNPGGAKADSMRRIGSCPSCPPIPSIPSTATRHTHFGRINTRIFPSGWSLQVPSSLQIP
jgi:hypothetical protein